jgi:hypothetical protein
MRNSGEWGVRASIVLCGLLALLWLVGVNAAAQTFRGSIVGTVTDASGAAVAGANVAVHNDDTGVDRTTQTTADGGYLVPELPVGNYMVTIEKSGFQRSVTRGVKVDVATERRVDAILKPGSVNQQVVVSGDILPQVDTTTDTLGGVMTPAELQNLPLNGRDFQKAVYLTPGIAGSPDEITDSPGSFGVFSMNGARGRANNFLLDGTDMNDGYRNDPAINEAGVFGTPATILPVDAVQELNVLSNYMPEYGRNAGAVVNIVTKSGTNGLHGNFFDYFRNNALDARNYFNFVKGQRQAPFHNNQFGGSLGGPIIKDKTFFFVDYEGQREAVGVVTLACVPDPAQIAADEAAITVNPVATALLARNPWPHPNIPGTFGASFVGKEDSGCVNGTPNASITSPSYNNLSSVIAKVDHNFDKNNVLTGRYFIGDSTQSFPLALAASGGQLPGFNTNTPTRVQLVSISYVHIFSPTKVNELRYGWNRFAEGFFPQDQNFHPSSIGLCAAALPSECAGSGPADSGLPVIFFGVSPSGSAFSQLGATLSVPRHRVDTNQHAIENFSWKIAKHDLKFGFEFRRTSIQQVFDKDFRGKLTFIDSNPSAPGQTGTGAFSQFLQGNLDTAFGKSIDYFAYSGFTGPGGAFPSGATPTPTGSTLRHTFENSYGLYFQDTFHILPRLSLNYGLRWDYFGVVAEKNNLFSNFDTNPNSATYGQLVQVGPGGFSKLYQPDYRNFAPRVSVAWDVFGTGRTVVRSGYGIFYDAFSQDFFLGHLPYPPFFDPGPAYNAIGTQQVVPAKATGTISAGVPIYGAPGTPQWGCGSVECDIFGFDRHIRTPYMENYNLNIEQQIASKVVLQVGYVGSQGHRLFRFVDLSQPSAQAVFAADCPHTPLSQIGQSCLLTDPQATINDFAVPRTFGFPDGSFYIMQEQASAKSNYNSLQASLRVNGWHGITSVVNYVWSRSLDNASDGEDFEPNAAQPNDSTRPNLEYGPSNFDVPQRFTWIFAYDLPKMGGNWQRLKNGWGFNSAVTLQSGQPFQFNYNFDTSSNDFSGSGEGDDRPDVVGPIVYDQHHPSNFIQLTSFAIPCTVNVSTATLTDSDCVPGTRHFGNLGRDALRGPHFRQWDFAIYKTTSITERLNVQLRAEFFNILNHPNFANPFLPAFIADPAVNGATINGSRETGLGAYQIVATGDVGIGNPFLGGGGPRGIQLAAKFSF